MFIVNNKIFLCIYPNKVLIHYNMDIWFISFLPHFFREVPKVFSNIGGIFYNNGY